ncbi:MAG: hypothetical protein Q7N50_13415, partial [Armatimonadota bacterium]|nr:hypothetical protein [Armatimonadota bacterium]
SDFVGNASPEHPSRVKHLRLIRQLAVEVKGKCLTPTPSTINVACTPPGPYGNPLESGIINMEK